MVNKENELYLTVEGLRKKNGVLSKEDKMIAEEYNISYSDNRVSLEDSIACDRNILKDINVLNHKQLESQILMLSGNKDNLLFKGKRDAMDDFNFIKSLEGKTYGPYKIVNIFSDYKSEKSDNSELNYKSNESKDISDNFVDATKKTLVKKVANTIGAVLVSGLALYGGFSIVNKAIDSYNSQPESKIENIVSNVYKK